MRQNDRREGETTFHAPDGQGPEEPLPNLLSPLNETRDEVGSHEEHLALVVVLVVAAEHGPSRGIKGLVEAFLWDKDEF